MMTSFWALITAVFLLAGLVKGVIGMGLPTVAMGLLALTLPPAEAAAILVVPSLVTNVWQLLTGPRFAALAQRLWPMMVGVVAGTIAGAGLIAGDSSGVAEAGLGVALAVYAVVGLSGFKMAVSRWGAGHPGVFHALAWDAELGRIIDLHAYHQLISGDSFAKSDQSVSSGR